MGQACEEVNEGFVVDSGAVPDASTGQKIKLFGWHDAPQNKTVGAFCHLNCYLYTQVTVDYHNIKVKHVSIS